MKILDSTILIELLREKKNAMKKISELEAKHEELFTTQINAFEIIQGIYAQNKRVNEELVALEILLSKIKTLDLTYFAAHQAGKLCGELRKKGFTVSTGDALIAGIALANKIDTVVTSNEKDFSKMPGIKVETY